MKTNLQVYRFLGQRLPKPSQRRLVVLTGARQTGKTTLAKLLYGKLRYINLDAIEERQAIASLRTRAWHRTVGEAVLDEAQKEPSVFEKVKWSFDEGELDFSVLLGSSRLLLLDRVKESLAGRAFVYELWPLMPCELRSIDGQPQSPPLLDELLVSPGSLAQSLENQAPILLGSDEDRYQSAVEHLLHWGGMPELLHLEDETRREWLRSYQQTYLERDLLDLARLSDLQPFTKLQHLVMLRSGQLLSYSKLARDAQVSVATARRYMEYLGLTFQHIQLAPFHRNLTSSVIKTPKSFWTDLGTLRQRTGQWADDDGAMFENFVIMECHKWNQTRGRDASLSFYRTRSGMEVDLIIEIDGGMIGVEIKNRPNAHGHDLRGLKSLAKVAGDKWWGGLLVTRGGSIELMDRTSNIWSVPAHRLL